MNNRIVIASLLSALAFLPQSSMATQVDCNSCISGGSVNAGIDLEVVVPDVIRFQLGNAAATPNIQWDYSGSFSTLGDSVTTAASAGGTTDNAISGTPGDGVIEVLLKSTNAGQVNLTLAVNDAGGIKATSPNAAAPTFDDFSVVTGGTIGHPAIPSTPSTSGAVILGIGLLDLTDTWTFSYANTKLLPAGTYAGTITYTVAIP